MNEPAIRMTQSLNPPSDIEVREWIGKKAHEYWKQVTHIIERDYPGVFSPEWLFGGKKHGWSLRYKKSKSFCTFIPEKDRLVLLIVFGAKEREKVETIRDNLSPRIQKKYDEATTYHDGKWGLLEVDSDTVVEDVHKLFAVKRKPKIQKHA